MDKILKSFAIHDTLCPDFWNNSESDDFDLIKLKPEIRQTLLKAANILIESLDIDVFSAEDVILTGSIANYNWSEYSDADIHIVTDSASVDKNTDIVKGFFDAKTEILNNKLENATIKGHDIELYIQDVNEHHESTGVFSILYDKWVITPSKETFKINLQSIDEKKDKFIAIIDELENEVNNGDYDADKMLEKLKIVREKIKKYRQSGLSKNGESSEENLVFKYLRRSGALEKLSKTKLKVLNNILTIESQNVD